MEEAIRMLNVYSDFAENFMLLPVVKGIKTASERFAGAVETFCIEGLMRRWKAHKLEHHAFFGSKFCKSFRREILK